MSTLKISGIVVRRSNGKPIPRLHVQMWDKDTQRPEAIATTVTGRKGQFTFDLSESWLSQLYRDRLPDVYFRILSGQQLIANTELTYVLSLSGEIRDITLSVDFELKPSDVQRVYTVRGRILSKNYLPADAYGIEVMDKGIIEDTVLAKTQTGKLGEFTVTFNAGAFAGTGKEKPDVFLKVTKGDAEPHYSTVVYNASSVTEFKEVIGGKAFPAVSEFERISGKMESLIGRANLNEIKERERVNPFKLLAVKTGEAEKSVQHFVYAKRLSAETQMAPEFYYALLRGQLTPDPLVKFAGVVQENVGAVLDLMKNFHNQEQPKEFPFTLETDNKSILDSLVIASAETVNNALDHAIATGIIPASFQAQREKTAEQWAGFRDSYKNGQQDDFKSLLDTTSLKAAEKKSLASLYDRHRGNFSKITEEAAKSVKDESLAEFRNISKLSELVDDVKIAAGLNKGSRIKGTPDLRRLAKLSREEWKEMLAAHQLNGSSASDKKVDAILENAKRQFPTAFFAGRLEKDSKAPVRGKEKVVSFLDMFTDAEFHKTNFELLFHKNKAAITKQFGDYADIKTEVKKIQRVFKLAPDYDKAKVLLDKGIHSSQAIYRMGKNKFIAKVTEGSISAKEAKKIYRKAEKSYAASLALLGEIKSLEQGSAFRVLPDVSKTYNALKHSTMKDFPDWKTLFTSSDVCECEHCRSVYSAAAYLTDILSWLDKRGSTVAGKSAKDILFDRRPDIGEIDLNCDNTNVAIPYADLAAEVLENRLASNTTILSAAIEPLLVEGMVHANVVAEFKLRLLEIETDAVVTLGVPAPQWFVRDKLRTYRIIKNGGGQLVLNVVPQTHGTVQERKAMPEFINYTAYDTVLKNALHPISLPFDLSWEESRAYLDKIQVNRAEWMEDFRNRTTLSPAAVEIAAEYIGLSPGDLTIITTANAAAQNQFWGGLPGLDNVATFLQRSELEYKQLLDLLELRFINPTLDTKIVHGDTTCNTETKTLSNLSAAKLDRINRFLRLWRKLGWKMWELDEAIMAVNLGGGNLNANFIRRLMPFMQLRAELKLSVEELIAYYADIIITGDKPHYRKLFRNPILLDPVPDAFREELVTQNPFVPAADRTISAQAAPLAAVLKVSQDDILQIRDELTLSDDLTLANISALYRVASLVRKAKLKVKEYFLLMEILNTGSVVDPFATTRDTWDFLDLVKLVKSSKMTVYELVYLLLNRDEGTKPYIPTDDKIITFITTVRTALQKIKDDLAAISGTPAEVASVLIGKVSYTDATGTAVAFDTDTVNTLTQIFEGTYTDTQANRDIALDASLGMVIDTATVKTKLNDRDAAPDAQKPEETNEAYETLNELLREYLGSSSSTQAVHQLHAENFKITESLSQLVLDTTELPAGTTLIEHWFAADFLEKDPVTGLYVKDITTANFPALFDSYRLLNKVSMLNTRLPLNRDTMALLYTNAGDFNVLAYDSLPVSGAVASSQFGAWRNYVWLYQFSTAYPDSEDGTLANALVKLVAPVDTEANFLDALSAYTLWDIDELTTLKTQLGFVFPADYRKMETYIDLDVCMNKLVTVNLQASQVALAIKPAPVSTDAINIKQMVKTLYDNQQWLDTSANIQSIIREKKRDALIAYYTHHAVNGMNFEDTNDLYSYYLLDVEMGSLEITTRVLQAYLSTQLFVQRCLMNLEADVIADATDDGWLQWPWMKNYRVWEANRKVFLYPENWIEPELRLDKSYFFQEMENDLMQNEINQTNVENAYLSYLEKLDNVARLDVAGQYYDHETYTLYVVARTYDDPNIYYYRKWVEDRYWTPWEKIDLEINATHVIPIVINQRIYLYWPDFREASVDSDTATVPALSGSEQTVNTDKPDKHWEIRLAVSEFRNEKWTPKKLSKTFITTPNVKTLESPDLYTFIPLDLISVCDHYLVGCFMNTNADSYSDYGYNDVAFFDLGSCKGTPEVLTDSEIIGLVDQPLIPQFERAELLHLESKESNYKDLPAPLAFQMGTFINHIDILNETPGRFRAPVPAQLSFFDKFIVWIYWQYMQALKQGKYVFERGWPLPYPVGTFLPFFYEDKKRTFFVQHELILWQRKERLPAGGPANGEDGPLVAELFYTDVVQAIEQYLRTGEWTELVQPFFENNQKPNIAYRLKFNNFYHPYVCFLIKQYYKSAMQAAAYAPDGSKYTLDGFFRREVQLLDKTTFPEIVEFKFKDEYDPTPIVNTGQPTATDPHPYYPKEEIDFSSGGSYSDYNWELFFHAPLMLAQRLKNNQRFEEAMHWFHYIFNPTDVSSNPSPQKFWITKPFFQRSNQEYLDERIDNILTMINSGDSELIQQVEDWRKNAFQPHMIAKFRTVAYQKTVVMKYLDNLIAWGDNLFRSDRREAIGEATQLYILAAEILGPKPKVVPKSIDPVILNYNQLEPKLDAFSNAMVEMENFIPYLEDDVQEFDPSIPLPSLETFYYCIPQNDKMMEYWDTVGDRLFKIRHSMNIDGVERTLALFDPPIDPGLLVKAVASGLSLSAAISGLNAPLPYYRFLVMVQKANEFCNEVKSLAGALLAALEKKDAEQIAQLRSTHEIRLLDAMKQVRKKQIEEAKASVEVLHKTKAVTEERKKYYGSLSYMNAAEIVSFALSTASTVIDASVAVGYALSGGLKLIPQFIAGGSGFGGSPHVTVDIGGKQFGDSAEDLVRTLASISHALDKGASLASTQGSYQRRQEEWDHQKKLADKELVQIDKQIAAAEIRVAMAEKELASNEVQIENAKAADELLRSKFTNKDLYDWMIGQISTVYFQTYQLAYDLAKKAEKCYRYELGITNTSFIQFGYWDSLRKGLMTGEKLGLDIRRMEASWYEQNKREFEITRHISLAQLDPVALLKLKQTGECFFQVPEEIYDIDYPGHYFRRLKSVGVSVPSIVGPYNNVNCTLTILKSRIRTTPNTSYVDYSVPPTEDDPGFTFNFAAIQSIVTSSAQNDNGMFDTNMKDERYLPFEGHGAISEWKLEMNKEFSNFDFDTISDVVLHVRYTARQGGKTLATKVKSELSGHFDQIIKTYQNGTGFFKLVSMKTDFPTEFHKLLYGTAAPFETDLNFESRHIPYWLSGKNLEFVDDPGEQLMYIKTKAGQTINVATLTIALNGQPVSFAPPVSLGDLKVGNSSQSGALYGTWTLSSGATKLDPAKVDDVMLLVKYKIV